MSGLEFKQMLRGDPGLTGYEVLRENVLLGVVVQARDLLVRRTRSSARLTTSVMWRFRVLGSADLAGRFPTRREAGEALTRAYDAARPLERR